MALARVFLDQPPGQLGIALTGVWPLIEVKAKPLIFVRPRPGRSPRLNELYAAMPHFEIELRWTYLIAVERAREVRMGP